MHRRICSSQFIRPLLRFVAPAAIVAMMLVPSMAYAQGAGAGTPSTTTNNNPICAKVGQSIQLSSGGRMWCFGPQNGNGGSNANSHAGAPGAQPFANSFPSTNVDAANPAEDISPSGVRAYGQSEESVARWNNFVVEAWNDSTGFFSSCGAPEYKEELTGFGFSSDGGRTFTDMGGLPNLNCANFKYEGDPSVEVWAPGGRPTFYISSLYDSTTGLGLSYIAMDACQVIGSNLSCGQPIMVAASTQCEVFGSFSFCDFLDKDFLAIDAKRGRLYADYTEFGFTFESVEASACDIGTTSGGVGPEGGTAMNPVCGGIPANLTTGANGTPYFTVATSTGCNEIEGAYPAVNIKTGDLYVAYEDNWATNLFGCNLPTFNQITRTAYVCLTLTPVSPCAGPNNRNGVTITSMDSAFIPGYNRFPMNDFPRIAYSKVYNTVSMVWNDATNNPTGDILMATFHAGNLSFACCGFIRLNLPGGWNFLPAVRQADNHGNINVSWYNRSSGNSALTNVVAALSINPLTQTNVTANVTVTAVASNWVQTSSDIVPNFGDYTDNYLTSNCNSGTVSYLGQLNVAWADGSTGVPQPYFATGSGA